MFTVKCNCSRGSVATAWDMIPSVTVITSNMSCLRAQPPTVAMVELPKALVVVGRMMLLLRRRSGVFSPDTGPRFYLLAHPRAVRSRVISREMGLQVQEIF